MLKRIVLGFGWMLLAFGFGGARLAFCEERAGFRPEEIQIGRLDVQDGSFQDLADRLRQACGMTVEVDPELPERSVYLHLRRTSLEAVLEVALPSQGATWELQEASTLRLLPLPRPWAGPAEEQREEPQESLRRRNYQFRNISIRDLVNRLGNVFLANLVCDYRVEQRPVQLSFTEATFEEAVGEFCATWGLQWKQSKGMTVILPSQEDQLLRFPCLRWRHWAFSEVSGQEVAEELAGDFNVPIHPSRGAARDLFTGQIGGETLGDVVDDYCRQTNGAYAVFQRTLYIVQGSEVYYVRSDATLPQLDVHVELVDIPADSWMRQKIDELVKKTSVLPPDEAEEQMAQIRQLSGAVSRVQHTLTLEPQTTGEVRLEPASPGKIGPIVLTGRFHYLNRDYASLSFGGESESTEQTPRVLQVSFDNQTVRLDRPYLYCSELQRPGTGNSSVVVVYLKFQVRPPTKTPLAAAYRPTVWHVPLRLQRRWDRQFERYYSRFPGKWSNRFVAQPAVREVEGPE